FLSSHSSHLSFTPPVDHRHLLSFPTRRSSDLLGAPFSEIQYGAWFAAHNIYIFSCMLAALLLLLFRWKETDNVYKPQIFALICRSEEHTSELQSRENLVCRLLLEKKKTTRTCT